LQADWRFRHFGIDKRCKRALKVIEGDGEIEGKFWELKDHSVKLVEMVSLVKT
jgi:hypothetical protein